MGRPKTNTAFDRYLKLQLKNTTFAAEYKKAKAEILAADKRKAK